MKTTVVCGAGGFIGGHLVAHLLRSGDRNVRAIDIKPFDQWHQCFEQADNVQLDLRIRENCYRSLVNADEVYNLAADMGGMGFIENNKALCMLSVLINTHLLEAARDNGAARFFYASSACVYNTNEQGSPSVRALREEDAYPALPEDGYGWEKLFSERMCANFAKDFGMEVRVARYHNVYGPFGTWQGGREKAPAAILRKVIEAKVSGNRSIQIWGDGKQTRSFTFIDDCIHGTQLLMHGDVEEPLNIGSSELVSIDQLVDLAEEIAGVRLERHYQLDAPKGVRGRNSDNAKIVEAFGWEPTTRLRDGLERTYEWIYEQYVGSREGTEPDRDRKVPRRTHQRPARQWSVSKKRMGSNGQSELTIGLLGAGGFIGSHLVEHLLNKGEHRIIGVDVADDKLTGISGDAFEFHEADLRKEGGLLEEIVRRSDVVVDLVAHANPSLYVTSPVEVFELNFLLNLDVANLCMRYGKRLIQYSSAEVYGKPIDGNCFSEDFTDLVMGPVRRHRWIYAAGKSLLERVLHAHGLEGNLEYTIIRPFNFIGSRLDYLVPSGSMGGPRVFPHFMSALVSGGPMFLVDGGQVHRAFLHVHDANRAFQTLLDRFSDSRNEIYNVGNPENNLRIRDLAILMGELYEELTGTTPTSELRELTGEEFYGAGYEDSDRLPPDTRKIRSLGWRPRYDLRATFREAMLEYLEHPERLQDALGPPVQNRQTGTDGSGSAA